MSDNKIMDVEEMRRILNHTYEVLEKVKDYDFSPKINAEPGEVLRVYRNEGYWHYGVYSENNMVIHYVVPDSKVNNSNEGEIKETSYDIFSKGSDCQAIEFKSLNQSPSIEDSFLSGLVGGILGPVGAALTLAEYIKKNLEYEDFYLYNNSETLERARSRIGESKYNLITNNCEHFAIWCKTNLSKSEQVENLFSLIGISQL